MAQYRIIHRHFKRVVVGSIGLNRRRVVYEGESSGQRRRVGNFLRGGSGSLQDAHINTERDEANNRDQHCGYHYENEAFFLLIALPCHGLTPGVVGRISPDLPSNFC